MSGEDEDLLCILCNKIEKSAKKVVECAYCHKCEHLVCKKVLGSAARRLRSQLYLCSSECMELHQRTTAQSNVENQLLQQMRDVITEIQGMKSEVIDLKVTIGALEQSQETLSGKMDEQIASVSTLQSEYKNLRLNVELLDEKHEGVSGRVDQLEDEVDRLQRANVSKHAIFLGLPSTPDEDPVNVIKLVAKAINYDIPEGAITQAKRLVSKEPNKSGNNTHPIKVIFAQDHQKEEFFNKKKQFGDLLSKVVDPSFANCTGKVIIRDELTPHGMQLLKAARDIQVSAEIKYVWPGRNGVVLAKKTDISKTIYIRSYSDIEQLERLTNKRPLNSTLDSSSQSSSSQQEPGPKR